MHVYEPFLKAPKIKKQTSLLHLPNDRADRSSPIAGSRRMRPVLVGHEAQDRMRSPAQQGWRAHHQHCVEASSPAPHRAVVAGEEGRTDRDERTDEEDNRTSRLGRGGSDVESSGAGRGWTRSGTDIRHPMAFQTAGSKWRTHM